MKNLRKPYTQNEIDFIRKNYGKMLLIDISNSLNRTLNSVRFVVYRLNKSGDNLHSELDHSPQQIKKMKEKKSIPLNNSIYNHNLELAYIIGVLNGDGCLSHRRIFLNSIDKDFIKNFNEKIENWSELKPKTYKYFDTKSHNYKQGFHYETMINSIKIKEFLMQFYISKNEEAIKNINKFLNKKELQIAFIEGFFDSEGTINKEISRIRITNINKNILELIKRYLKNIKIKSIIYKDKRSYEKRIINKMIQPIFIINIQDKENIKKFCNIIDSSIKRKQDKILKIRNNQDFLKALVRILFI